MTQYVKHSNGFIEQYPYSLSRLRGDFPHTSFPTNPTPEELAPHGVEVVVPTAPPSLDPRTHKAVQVDPVRAQARSAEGAFVADDPQTQVNEAWQWVQQWTVEPLTADELAEIVATLQAEIVAFTQQRLDDFARTRNYDGILSAATYATSTVPKFQAEGQCAVTARDATWAKLHEILAEVEGGVRPMPSGFADIEPELPALAWPV